MFILTESFKDKMTWKKFPNKEENDRFYEEHLEWCKKQGVDTARREIERTRRSLGEEKAKIELMKFFNNVLLQNDYNYLKGYSSSFALRVEFYTRLRKSDGHLIMKGYVPEDIWDAFLDGWKRGMLLGM